MDGRNSVKKEYRGLSLVLSIKIQEFSCEHSKIQNSYLGKRGVWSREANERGAGKREFETF